MENSAMQPEAELSCIWTPEETQNPHESLDHKYWKKIFIASCLCALLVDPLFLYVPILKDDIKCLMLDQKLKITVLILRSITDFFYLMDIIIRIYRPENYSSGLTEEHDDSQNHMKCSFLRKSRMPREAKLIWMSHDILIDIVAVLPFSQVAILIFFSKMSDLRSLTTTRMVIMNVFVLLQYLPRVLRIYLSVTKFKRSLKEEITVTPIWIKGVLNFSMYIIASHVFGAVWYFFGIQRMMICWHSACRKDDGCDHRIFSCHDHHAFRNTTILDDLCPVTVGVSPSDIMPFDFGIFATVLDTGIVGSTNYFQKFLTCFWWGLRNLSSLGSNLQPSIDGWETLYTVMISIIGLLMFLYLIGNLQMYMQFEITTKEKSKRKTQIEQKMKRKGREIELWLFKKGIATRSNEAMKSQFMQKVQQALEEHRSTDLDDIFPIIPLDVQSRIKDSMPLIKLKQARMLQGINKDVLKMICRKLEPKRYTGNEIIIQKDQALENMLFIVDGNVLIKKGSNDSDDSKRGAGELCGEELLRWPFSTSFPRKKPSATESVQATSVVEALALKACDLESIYNQSSITSIEKPRHRRLMKEEIEQNIDLLMPRNEIPRRLNNDEKSWIMKMVEQQFQEGKVVYWDRLYSDWDELKVVLIPNLTTLAVHQCDSLRFLFSSSMAKCLGQLKHLTISKCQALQMVYDTSSTTQVNGFECPNLHFVDIDSCDSLKNVFPASVAKDLKQLKMLKVKNCDLLEEIVAKKEGPEKAYEEFEFPKVTFMEFHNLPQLGSFYPGLHVSNWPSLNILKFTKCGGVEILPAKFSTYQDKLELGHPRPTKQPFFLMEKDKSFLNLERLVLDENTEILYGPLLAELLRKLKGIGFATSHPKSDDFFENLQNIEELHVFSAPWKELIVHNHQGSSSGEIHEGKTLPRVKGLWLGNMPELIHLGKENSQPGCPVFPNLEFLCLEKCGRLENLASTLISFWNLTTLTILDCHGLQYLIPYSVAKNLQQLKKLVVKSCERMVEIVASNENDSENEITFNCLKHLQLSGLPSLQGFCTGNCIFKVPSLPTLIVEDCQLIKLKISPDGLLQSDPRPERQQIAEETDDVLKLSDSKENDRDQTDQLMIADTN